MASGQSVVRVLRVSQPLSNYATPNYINGGSSYNEIVPCYDFNYDQAHFLDFICYLHNYQGGGLKLKLPWAASNTGGDVQWYAGIRRLADDAEAITSSHTYDYNVVTDTAPDATGELSYAEITFTDGADMDSWANGEIAIIRIERLPNHFPDTLNTGVAKLLGLIGIER